MTPQSIYKTVLLPEILDFCQDFFPALVEQSQRQCHQACIPSARETSDSLNQFNEWLKRCLAAPLTQIADTSLRSIPSNINALATKLTQHINFATDSGLTTQSNPLSQHRLIDALEKAFTINCEMPPQQLMAAIDAQFAAQAYSFYSQLNDLCCAYYRPKNKPENNEAIFFGDGIPKPRVCLDTDTHEELAPPSLNDAEEAIKTVKHFFDTELCADKVGHHFYALGKKLYIPVVNCVLTNPREFLARRSGTMHHFLQAIKVVAQHHQQAPSTTADTITADAESIIQHFIHSAMGGSVSLRQDLQALKKLADECINRSLESSATGNASASNVTKHQNTRGESRAQAVQSPIEENAPPACAWVAEAPVADSVKNPAGSDAARHADGNACGMTELNTGQPQSPTKPSPMPSIRTQAENLLQSVLAANDPNNCIAAKLRHDWQQVLEHIGSQQGANTQAWSQAMEIFVQLTQYASAKAMPVALARQVENQLRLVGIKNSLISSRTSPPRIGPQYAAILKEGNWFSYNRNGRIIRCKLGAVIRQIGRYIFISRQGQKVLEIDYSDLKKELATGALVPLDNDPLNNTLEDILCNIRHAQNKETEKEAEAPL